MRENNLKGYFILIQIRDYMDLLEVFQILMKRLLKDLKLNIMLEMNLKKNILVLRYQKY